MAGILPIRQVIVGIQKDARAVFFHGFNSVLEDDMSGDVKNNQLTEQEMQENFDVLASDVDWQYLHLYKFIVKNFKFSKVERVEKRNEIDSPDKIEQRVLYDYLTGYLNLLERFYTQFRNDLKSEYIKKNVLDTDVPVLMQKALNKLVEEWERVYSFIVFNLKESDTEAIQKFLNNLEPIINVAVQDVGINPESVRIIHQFGNAYSLGFLNYSNNFTTLNVPMTKVKSPWEWTIFWHEMAGLKVRLLKKTLVEYQNILEELFVEVKRLQDKELITKLKNIPDDQSKYDEDQKELSDACTMIFLLSSIHMDMGQQKSMYTGSFDDSTYLNDLWHANAEDLLIFLESDDLSLTKTKNFFKDQSRPMYIISFDDLLPEIMDELRIQQETAVIGELRASLEKEVLNIKKSMDEQGEGTQALVDALGTALALNNVFAARKKALDEEGWSSDWLEELFEDSFSVINFNLEFLFILDNLLGRYRRRDQRHPPRDVRLAVALSLKLLSYDDESRLENFKTLPNVSDWPTWNKEKMGLTNEAEYKSLIKFYDNLKTDKEVIWIVAKKIWSLYNWSVIEPKDTGEKRAISKAMSAYRSHKSQEWENIANRAFGFLNKLKLETGNISDLNLGDDRIDEKDKSFNQKDDLFNPFNINNLLNRKRLSSEPLGYRELLDISFYDEDFGEPLKSYSFTYNSKTYSITSSRLTDAINGNFIFASRVTGTDMININGNNYWTTFKNINDLKAPGRRWII